MRKLGFLLVIATAAFVAPSARAGCVGVNGGCNMVPLVHANVDVGADHLLVSGGLDSGTELGDTGVIVDATGPLFRVKVDGAQVVGPTGVIIDFTGPVARVFVNGGQVLGSTGIRLTPGGFTVFFNGSPLCVVAITTVMGDLTDIQACSAHVSATGIHTTGDGRVQIWVLGVCRAGIRTQPLGVGC